jgi:hypothetical protein
LPSDGTYTLVVSPARPGDLDSFGSFTFRVQQKIDPPALGLPDSQGTEFWMAFPSATTTQQYTLLVSAEQSAQVMVEIPHLGFVHAADVPAGGLTPITLPTATVMERVAKDIIENKGVHVVADQEVTIYAILDGQFSSDAYLALPVDALGHEHLIVSHTTGCSFRCGQSEFTVVAAQDNTTVTITPTIDAGNGRLAGVPYHIPLEEGQTYRVAGGSYVGFTELTGTSVIADKPVFVLGGNRVAQIPVNVGYGDHIIEQMPSVSSWGRQFVTVPFATRIGGDTFKLLPGKLYQPRCVRRSRRFDYAQRRAH